ncbi:UBP-type zinc finger domain-containing protein [Streptomyces sp. NBC_00178]|uniref:UBP-type zinc finger domain-containing protein n=1 Tax=Streptomyces sp. NBC_00178 TaxID=2975672 RepID=UPI002E2DFDB5|nr:UBP-type zinc finger domain-containing protein [Streptomyces sp. NBC_00178]
MAAWRVAPDAGALDRRSCAHEDADEHLPEPETAPACDDCPAGAPFGSLLHCLTCGHVGCSDSSAGQHAYGHARTSGHPLARSLRSGDTWAWCYEDELFLLPTDEEGPVDEDGHAP